MSLSTSHRTCFGNRYIHMRPVIDLAELKCCVDRGSNFLELRRMFVLMAVL